MEGGKEYTRYGRRRRRPWKLLAAGAIATAGLLGAGAWLARAEEGRLPPGVVVAGVDVGGRSLAEARSMLRQAAGARAGMRIVLLYEGGRLQTSGVELGAVAGIDAALDDARRSRGTFSRLAARLGLSDGVELGLEYRVDSRRLDAVVGRIASEVERPVSPAEVRLAGDEVVVVPSSSGRLLDQPALAARLELLPASVEIPVREVPPSILDPAALATKARTDALLASPPAVVFGSSRTELTPDLLRRSLSFEPGQGTIDLVLDASVLAGQLKPIFRRYERRPRDAGFRPQARKVRLVPARRGRELDVERIAEAVAASPGIPEVGALFQEMIPERTTKEAKALRIRELVSEFTTPYACCAPRVTNIQLAAKILDGTIIPAGGRFSLNEALGRRTPERGFVLAPMITAGRLEDAVGGGVSQVATTFYNAAFFAGLELIEHTPHQFYISRYPMGREATVSWGGPELVFKNDWPAAILVKVAAEDTAITVRFYSARLGRRVETETGAPYSPVPARVRTVKKPTLRPGTKTTVQHGGVAGFSVNYTRKVYRGPELVRNERFHVEYDPEDTIVEVGPKPKKPKEKDAEAVAGDETGGAAEEPPAEEPLPVEEPAVSETPDASVPPSEPGSEVPAG